MVSVANAELKTAADVVHSIETAIASGGLAPGQRLEPVRSLADGLGLAPATVASAYKILAGRGLVVGRGRRGTFVVDRPALVTPTLHSETSIPDGLVDLARGNPDPDLLPDWRKAFAALPDRSALYGQPPIDPRLAPILRSRLDDLGVDPSHLVVVGGALDGLERALASNLRPGDHVALEDPGYSSVIELVVAMGLIPLAVPVDDYGPRPEALERVIAAGARAAIITPRAQNPTGAALTKTRADELAVVLDGADQTLLLIDDHAGPIAGQPYHHITRSAGGRWLMFQSVAKSLGPDLRFAVGVGDETTVSRVAGRQVLGTGWVSGLLQAVVYNLLTEPEMDSYLAAAAEVYRKRREAVVAVLSAAGIPVHGRSGLNVWVPSNDEAHAVAGMQLAGYAIRAGSRYRIDSPPGVRITVASETVDVLAEAAETLVGLVLHSAPSRLA